MKKLIIMSLLSLTTFTAIAGQPIVLNCNLQNSAGVTINGQIVVDFNRGIITNKTNGDVYNIQSSDWEPGYTQGRLASSYAYGSSIKIENSTGSTYLTVLPDLQSSRSQYFTGMCKNSTGN
jgi:hypothetical protein